MGYNRDVLHRRRDQLNEWGVRIRWAGRKPRLWGSVIKELQYAEQLTRGNDTLTLGDFVNTATISNVETILGGVSNDTVVLATVATGTVIDLGGEAVGGGDKLTLATGLQEAGIKQALSWAAGELPVGGVLEALEVLGIEIITPTPPLADIRLRPQDLEVRRRYLLDIEGIKNLLLTLPYVQAQLEGGHDNDKGLV